MNELEKIGSDVGKVIAYPFVHTEHVIKVLDAIVKDSPQVRDAILGLVQQAATVDADVLQAIASKGMNLPVDLKTLDDAATFFQYFRSQFLPVIEQAYKDLNANQS